ncbi:MAG: biotin/lipoyl-binding protein [Halarcobacter sp.]
MIKKWFNKLYGLDKNPDEDLEFVYSSYSNANETPSKVANLTFIFIISFFTLVILWAAFAEVDELARGNGKVIPSDKIQRVQSLDGGIISEILVKDGESVKKGTPLMKIDTTRFQASLEESKQEYLSLLALDKDLKLRLLWI